MKRLLAALALALALGSHPAGAQKQPPITIGFGMALTGGRAANGKAALLAMQIWAENTNAKGGLLGRPVKLVYYDDQSNPAQVPGIYTKLLDVDKVDLVISGYGTNMIAPAMPVIIQHGRTFFALFGLDVNSKFHYLKYFSTAPTGGPHPRQSFSQPFFTLAAGLEPKPTRLALVGADAEFPKNALSGARELAKENKLSIVYDRSYPPSTADFTPIVRAIQATRPDLVFVASYPPDTVGMVRAAREVGLKARLFGGGMVGLQSTAIKTQLGELLNGIVDYDYWLPWGGLTDSPAMGSFMKQYQDSAGAAGVDALGYYLPPFAYSEMQVLTDAVEGTKSLADDKLADYLRGHQFDTIVGPIKFGPDGEWTDARVLEVQFQGVQGHDLAQFRDGKTEVILYPAEHKAGTLRAPYEDAQR
ncbi:MAG: amino acid ABC transporter substrate-binding protein [Acetobacteraceae bacterium]|nr:amino acid ABC transporter substrate-binding protein [Acetobacteraceae bacterium]